MQDQGTTTSRRARIVAFGCVIAGIFGLLAALQFFGESSDLETENAATSRTTTSTTSSTTTTTQLSSARSVGGIYAFDAAPVVTVETTHDSGESLLEAWENIPVIPNFVELTQTTTTTTTTTIAPTTTVAPTGPAPVSISRPSCASGLSATTTRTAPFTGRSAVIPAQMPAVVVKVSNNSSASRRALIGLDQADIVFEERIEASATRFFSVFHSSLPANVGPVRSGRTTDIQITQNLNRPVFAYSGSNQGVARQIQFAAENNILVPFINTDRAPFARDGRYSAPDNLFVDPASLGACGGTANPTAVFSYGAANSTTARPASAVALSARSPYRFDWNGSKWVRSQSGTPHVTRTGAPLAPDNVVIMFARTVQSQIDAASVDTETIGSGEAWILRDGTITVGGWRRGKGHEPYTLSDGNGTAIRLKAGQTWVVLAPPGTASWN